jgi:hypothetical protein
MDNDHHLKVKVGPHEFEATGSEEAVQAQFTAWKELIALAPFVSPPQPQITPPQNDSLPPGGQPKPDMTSIDSQLSRIMGANNRVVSLTVPPEDVEDAILLIIYGQRVLRSNDSVTGGEVMEGISATGGFAVSRVDRLLENVGRNGHIIVIGERRSKRYRLTNTGLTRAREIASSLLDILA